VIGVDGVVQTIWINGLRISAARGKSYQHQTDHDHDWQHPGTVTDEGLQHARLGGQTWRTQPGHAAQQNTLRDLEQQGKHDTDQTDADTDRKAE
jgi:hypothetical protein